MALLRSEVAENRKWDLSKLFKTEEAFEELFAEVENSLPHLASYAKKLNAGNAYLCLDESSVVSRKLERLYLYANLKKDEETSNPKYQALAERVSMLATKLSSTCSFIIPELSKLPVATAKEMLTRKEYANHTVTIEEVLRSKKHILSPKGEAIMAELSNFTGDFRNIFSMFDNADIRFGSVKDEQGEEIELSHGTYSVLLQSGSQEVRKNAFETYYKSFQEMLNTIAATYSGSVKKDCTLAKLRGYKSALGKALYADDIPVKVYDNLIRAVKKGTPAVHQYVAYRKKTLKLKELHMYDMYVALTSGYKLELEYDEAYKLVIEALAPLGKDYAELLKTAYSSGWIDVEETKNKRSGAYSWGCYDCTPYVLLNYQKTSHDVFTIAHELGHAIHSYESNAHQCYEKADYRIFVAEIASTVNEVLLLKHLLKKAEGESRKFLLGYYLDMFRTALFRQTMFAEFEKYAHGEFEAGRPLTAEGMSAEYLKLNKEYYGNSVISDPQIATEWARIPHFYNAFYVYKYATGLTTAVNIVNKILHGGEDYLKKYFAFLSTGGSLFPLETIKLAEVDLTKTEPFDFAMREFKDTLTELKKIK